MTINRPPTLETDVDLLYRLGRGSELVTTPQHYVNATTENIPIGMSWNVPYPMQVIGIRWVYAGDETTQEVVVQVRKNGDPINTPVGTSIPAGTEDLAYGDIPFENGWFELGSTDILHIHTNGNVGNPLGALTFNVLLRPL